MVLCVSGERKDKEFVTDVASAATELALHGGVYAVNEG